MARVTVQGPNAHVGYAWSPDGAQWVGPVWGSAERLLSERTRIATSPPPGFRERLYASGVRAMGEVVDVRDHGPGGRPWGRWSAGAVLAALCQDAALDLELAEPG